MHVFMSTLTSWGHDRDWGLYGWSSPCNNYYFAPSLLAELKRVALLPRTPAWGSLYEEKFRNMWNPVHENDVDLIPPHVLPLLSQHSSCRHPWLAVPSSFPPPVPQISGKIMKSPVKRCLQPCTVGHALPLKKATQAIISRGKLQHGSG